MFGMGNLFKPDTRHPIPCFRSNVAISINHSQYRLDFNRLGNVFGRIRVVGTELGEFQKVFVHLIDFSINYIIKVMFTKI